MFTRLSPAEALIWSLFSETPYFVLFGCSGQEAAWELNVSNYRIIRQLLVEEVFLKTTQTKWLFVVACLWRVNGLKICQQSTKRTFPPLTPVTSLHVPELYLRPSGDRKGRQNNRKRHHESAQRRNKTKSVAFPRLLPSSANLTSNQRHRSKKPEAAMWVWDEDTCVLCCPIFLTL